MSESFNRVRNMQRTSKNPVLINKTSAMFSMFLSSFYVAQCITLTLTCSILTPNLNCQHWCKEFKYALLSVVKRPSLSHKIFISHLYLTKLIINLNLKHVIIACL